MWRLFPPDSWLPPALRRDHPLVRQHLNRLRSGRLAPMLGATAASLLVLFGGFGLPVLFGLCWLALLVWQAAGAAGRVRCAYTQGMWDLLLAAPFSRRELLLSTWAGSFWQIYPGRLTLLYRLLQVLAVTAIIVVSALLPAFPLQYGPLVVLAGVLAILAQPAAELYLSGMAGLWCGVALRGHIGALALAAGAMVFYWAGVLGMVLLLLFADPEGLDLGHVLAALLLPTLLPLLLGLGALRAAERFLA